MMETPIKTQSEEIKDEIGTQSEAKPAVKKAAPKNNSPKKNFSNKKNVKSKITDEIFNDITRRNSEEGIPFHVLCAEYHVSESSLNYRRAKLKESSENTKKLPATKQKDTAKLPDALDSNRIKELEQDCNYLRNEYMDLLLRYNRLLSKK